MTKRVIKVTKKGIVDDGPIGSGPSNSADFEIDSDSTLIEGGGRAITSRAIVAPSTTGSISNNQYWVFATTPAQVNLPTQPVDGQIHRIIAFGVDNISVSGSGVVIARPGGGTPAAVDVFSGSATYREYYYEAQTPLWISLASSNF